MSCTQSALHKRSGLDFLNCLVFYCMYNIKKKKTNRFVYFSVIEGISEHLVYHMAVRGSPL